MLRNSELSKCRHASERDFLHRVVEVVGAGLSGSERLASGAVLGPEETAARVGVGDERAVGVERRAKAVLFVVEVLFFGEGNAASGVDAPFAEKIAVCGIALGMRGDGRDIGLVGRAGRTSDDRVGNRVGIGCDDAVFVGSGDEGVAQEKRNAESVGIVARFDRDRIVGIANGSGLGSGANGFGGSGWVAVFGAVRVARPDAPDERDGATAHEIARLGADLIGVCCGGVVSGKRRVVAERGNGGERLRLQTGEGVGRVECACQQCG